MKKLKHSSKRLLAVLIVLMMCLSMFSLGAYAENDDPTPPVGGEELGDETGDEPGDETGNEPGEATKTEEPEVETYEAEESIATFAEENEETYEETLRAAIAQGGTVELTEDVTLMDTLTISGEVTLDLKGHTVTSPYTKPAILVPSGTTFILDDTAGDGVLEGNYAYNSTVRVEGGTFTMNGGTVTNDYYDAVSSKKDTVYATITINDGTIEATSGGIACAGIYAVQTYLTVNGGTIIGKGYSADGIDSKVSLLSVYGGTIRGSLYGITVLTQTSGNLTSTLW